MIDMIGAQQRCGDGKQRRRDNVHAMLGAKAETAVAAGRVERRCRGCIPEHGSTAGTADVDGKKDGHVSAPRATRSEEHTSELQSRGHLVCRLLLENKK